MQYWPRMLDVHTILMIILSNFLQYYISSTLHIYNSQNGRFAPIFIIPVLFFVLLEAHFHILRARSERKANLLAHLITPFYCPGLKTAVRR